MILLIDNYDSFVFNLARYVVELGYDCQVRRNDKISLSEILLLAPSHIILSPGPCSPTEAGICLELIEKLGPYFPILGVCLGHQAIVQACGGNVVRAARPMHGKADKIFHTQNDLFANLPNPLTVARYHSLIAENESMPSSLVITAMTAEQEIMAVKHTYFPLYGVQFHPESVLTEGGHEMLKWFLKLPSYQGKNIKSILLTCKLLASK